MKLIDTRMKVDGKWNFKWDNVWFLFVMFVLSVWILLEIVATYGGYLLTGEIKIGIMLIINVMFMAILTIRRLIDRLLEKQKQTELRLSKLESGE